MNLQMRVHVGGGVFAEVHTDAPLDAKKIDRLRDYLFIWQTGESSDPVPPPPKPREPVEYLESGCLAGVKPLFTRRPGVTR